jgi:hypothetical protein
MHKVEEIVSLIKHSISFELGNDYRSIFHGYASIIFDIIDDPQFHFHLDDIIRISHQEDSLKL